jgi:hypothetical protein
MGHLLKTNIDNNATQRVRETENTIIEEHMTVSKKIMVLEK